MQHCSCIVPTLSVRFVDITGGRKPKDCAVNISW